MRPQLNDRIAGLIEQGRYRQALPLAQQACSSSGVRSQESGVSEERDAPSAQTPERAASLTFLGVVQRELGAYHQAEAPLLQALSIRAAVRGKDHPEYAATLHELGRLYEELAQYASAERLYRSALTIRQQALGANHPDVARSLYDLGSLLDLLARYPEAETLHEQCLAIRQMSLGEAHADYALSLTAQAYASWRRGRMRQSESLARRAVNILEASRGAEHPDNAASEQLLSRLMLHQARLEQAEKMAQHVVDVRRDCLGEHHHRYAAALENLALVHAVQGRGEGAEKLARQAVGITRAALGERHPFLADSLAALAFTLNSQRRHDQAERHYQEALAICQAVHGDDHAGASHLLRDLAEVCATQQRLGEAEEHYRRAMQVLEPLVGSCLMELAETRQALARVLVAQNRPEEAQDLARQTVSLVRSAVARSQESGVRSQESEVSAENATAEPTTAGEELLASSLDGLARVLQAQGSFEEAETVWREVLACRSRSLGELHPLYADTLRCLAALHQTRGDFPEATRLEEQALEILRQTLGEHHPDFAQSLAGLAELCCQKGDLARGESLLIQVVDLECQRTGENHSDHVQAVQQLARLYLSMNNLPAAEVRFRQVLRILERLHGDEHPAFAGALHDLATLHHQAGDLASAEQLYQQAREIRQTDPGEQHPDYALSLHGLAMVYQTLGRFEEAAPLFEQAVLIVSAALGEDNPTSCRYAHSQALFEQARGNVERAERQLSQVLEQLTTLLGEGSPHLTPVLGDLARIHASSGNHLAAEPLWRQVTEINRAAFPEDRLMQAQDQVNLAITLRALGESDEAERLVRDSLQHVEAVRGPDHPEVAGGLGMLAGLVLARSSGVRSQGSPGQGDNRDEAELLYRQALERTRAALGQNHPAVAAILADLGGLYAGAGQLAKALDLYRQACEVVRGAFGEDHAEHLNLLRILGTLHQAVGEFAEAEQLYRRRLTILRRLFGPNSTVLAPGQQLLADLYRAQGRLEEAETMCRQALDLLHRNDEVGTMNDEPEDPLTSSFIVHRSSFSSLSLALAENNLATLLLSQDKPEQAEPLLRRSLAGTTECVGEDHSAHAGSMLNLVGLCISTGRQAEALALMQQLVDRDTRHLPQLLALTPERLRALSCHGCHENYELYLSLAVPMAVRGQESGVRSQESGVGSSDSRLLTPDPCLPRRLYDLVLKRKRFGLEVLAVPFQERLGRKHPQHAARLRRLALLDRQIAGKRLSGPGHETLRRSQELLADWLEERERLEQQLARQIPELARRRRLREADAAAVSAALPAGWALVEFAFYRPLAPIVPGSTSVGEPRPGRYIAFILKGPGSSGEPATPFLLDLGPAEPIDRLALAWRQQLEGLKSSQEGDAGAALRSALFDQILPLVEDCRGVVLAVDGELFHTPLDALPLPEGGKLMDHFQIRQATSGRDLLRWASGKHGEERGDQQPPGRLGYPAGEAIVLGGLAQGGGRAVARGWRTIAARLWGVVRAALGGSPGEGRTEASEPELPAARRPWIRPEGDPDPDTTEEAQRLAQIVSARACLAGQATTQHLGDSASPQLVHLGAAGFFVLERADPPGVWENPLMLSGVILAGGELLTAQTVTSLDLWRTDVVILSNCHTPVHHSGAWSRVSGLIGAFLHAGANHVLLSLWQAPGPARRLFLETFFNGLAGAQSPALAFRQAQQAVRAVYPAPQAWAGWLCIGCEGWQNEERAG